MANKASVNLSNDEVEFVQCADDHENPEETMENLPMETEPSTQYVLEVEPAEEPKKKGKGKGKSTNLSITKKKIMNHGFVRWLKSIWIADTTLRIMKPWLKAINEESLRIKNQKMFLIGQTISQVMKQFFIHMKEAKKSLTECSYGSFEEWCLDEGLSMMSGKLLEMDWEDDLTAKLFDLYSDCIMELRRLQKDLESDNDQEVLHEKQRTAYKESSSLPNMKNISTSYTTVHTREVPADAFTYNDCETTQQQMNSRKRTLDGAALKTDMWTKEKSPSKNKKSVQFESESEDEAYRPGQLFKSKKAVEEMSDPELPEPSTKKQKRRRLSSTSSESDQVPDEEAFTSMVDSLARAHSLTPSTGKISQNILIKDGEGFISFTSPGERGSMLVKLELYPFKDCVRLDKNQYWTKRVFSSLAVVCSKNSPAYKTLMKLREQLTQQVGEIKGVKIEKKAPTGWKRS